MVAPTWLLMSSPTIGTPASSNFLAHSGVGGDEDGQRVDEGDLRVDRALGVELVGGLGAHREVGDEHVGPGVLEHLDDVDRLGVGLVDGLAVVLAEAVEGVAALHGDAGRRHVADPDGVVLRGLRGVGEVEPDLLGVDVERRDELDVGDVVVTERRVHQAGHGALGVGVLVVLDALDQGRRAVADAHDCYSNRTHGACSFLVPEQLPGRCFRWSRQPLITGLRSSGWYLRDRPGRRSRRARRRHARVGRPIARR